MQNLSSLESLLSNVSLKSRGPCMETLEPLKDLWVNDLLAPERALKAFKENPFGKLEKLSGEQFSQRFSAFLHLERCLFTFNG